MSEKYESSKSQESASENPWADLEKLGENGFQGQETKERRPISEEPADKQEQISQAAARVKEAIERKAHEAEIEKTKLAMDMAGARDHFDFRKREQLKNQRNQEILERDLNSRLLTVEKLETEVIAGNPEVRKVDFIFRDDKEEAKIPIYHLNGLPFSTLSTTIDYRKLGEPGKIGTATSQAVIDDPSIWAERRDQAEQSASFGTQKADARGDTISASYRNSEKNSTSYVPGALIYGFEKVDGDSIIDVFNGDAGSSNTAGKSDTRILNYKAIDNLEGPATGGVYNEVLLRRYSDNGAPKLPDYIIVENNQFTPAVFRHAKYFNIPVININTPIYEQKALKHGEKILDSISDKDDYVEIEEKLTDLKSLSEFKRRYSSLETVGFEFYRPDIDLSGLEKKCFEVSKLELSKGLDFLQNTLEEAAENIEAATEKGLPAPQDIPQLDYLRFFITGAQKERYEKESATEHYDQNKSEARDAIEIEFKLKNIPLNRHITIYDGKGAEVGKEDNYYDVFDPIVRKYFEAYHKNQELQYSQNVHTRLPEIFFTR